MYSKDNRAQLGLHYPERIKLEVSTELGTWIMQMDECTGRSSQKS